MITKEMNENNEVLTSISLFDFLWRWKRLLTGVFVGTIILSAVVSLLITPKFKSTVIMFPTSTNSISKSLLAENFGGKEDILAFGEEERAEQMIQILHSGMIRDRVIEKFDLMTHYDIDPKSKYKMTQLQKKYENNIKYKRTKYMAVEVSVLDADAKMAQDIANEIAGLVDSVINFMQKERAIKAFMIVEEAYVKLKTEIDEMEDSLNLFRDKGIHDYESQAERLYETLAKELAAGNTRGIKAIEDRLEILARYGGQFVSIRDNLEHEKKQLSFLKTKYEEAKIDAEAILPQKFIVDHAQKAEKKSYPVRWLIVVVSTISALLMTIILIIFFDNLKIFLNLQK